MHSSAVAILRSDLTNAAVTIKGQLSKQMCLILLTNEMRTTPVRGSGSQI